MRDEGAAVAPRIILPGALVIGWLLGVGAFILWIILMFKAYQGQKYKLPWAGDFAEKQLKPQAGNKP